jgi:DnaK suppressor protein
MVSRFGVEFSRNFWYFSRTSVLVWEADMRKTERAAAPTELYRQMLLEKREEVLTALGAKFDTMARLGRVAEDDQAQISHDEFVSLRLNSLDYAQLRMIEEALDRLDSGDYGVCLACEEPIPAKRLRAVCWARYCVKCQDTVGREMDRNMAQTGTKEKPGLGWRVPV